MPAKKLEWYRRHCFNVVGEIVLGVLAIKDLSIPLDIQTDTGKKLLKEYDDCLAARTFYDRPNDEGT